MFLMHSHMLLIKMEMLLPSSFVCPNNFLALSPHVLVTGTFWNHFDFLGFWWSDVYPVWVLYYHFPMSLPKWLLVERLQATYWYANSKYEIITHIVSDQWSLYHMLNKQIIIDVITLNSYVTHCIEFWIIQCV